MSRGRALAALAMCALAAGRARALAREGDGACDDVVIRRARPMMATLVTVTAHGCDEAALEERVREAFAEMERLAAILSEWAPESPVSRVNGMAGVAPVPVPRELSQVLRTALDVSARTSGAFDATWAALSELWPFGAHAPRLPPDAEVERRRALVGYRHLVLDAAAGTAFLDIRGARLGLGGIAKGYIAQAAADLLVSRGIRNALVAVSGDIAARGANGDRPWRVGVRDPRDPAAVRATVDLHDESISTSGDYERFFVVGGRRYPHILDPRTGRPATASASVSVVARDGAVADALSTGLFVLGAERGARVVSGVPHAAALFVDRSRAVRSAGEPGRFDVVH